MTLRSRILKLHPAALVLASFLLAIALGAGLLKLPAATRAGWIPWIDALFTATSAVCVTGLAVVDTGTYFTHFGQLTILGLIQIGGLGVMTISVALFRWLGRSVSFRQRMIMQDLFAHTPRGDILNLVKSVVGFTLGAEILGAALLAIRFWPEMPPGRAVYAAVFHAVSAFCNAGFALYPDSLVRFGGDLPVNAVMGALIVLGGIGFPVLYDLQHWLRHRRARRARLAVHTRVVLVTTLLLIVAGALMFACLEREALAAAPTSRERWLAPLFQSITCRTAGFNTVDIASLQEATLALMILLMFVGASPGSCGGGVKTTTLALMTLFTVSRIRRLRRVNIFRKSIPLEPVTRSVSLLLVALGVIALVLFLLLVGDTVAGREAACQRGLFLGYLFETVSAFGTVGLSLGITPALSAWGKSWIVLTMIVGRVGVLTFAYIIVGAGTANGVAYAEENLMIG